MPSDRLTAKTQIEKLVRYFEQNIHQLKAPSFNEAQARQTLIDPFFEALGWDVRNRQMRPPHQWEVIPEGHVKSTAGTSVPEYVADDEYKAEQRMATKKPDYRFRLQGSTKFFVEAKKPFVDLMNNDDAIFQIKRYGFSARVPVSILTDFEEFRVFDCTRRPFYDKPKIGAIKEFDLGFKSYLDEFDRVYDTFSRDAVIAGSIEALQKKYLEKKTGEFALDREFLEDLSDWRLDLAKDIAKHPKNRRFLNEFTLKECVQRILDRIVFLRVCEDRGIEVSGTLLAILRLWQDHPALSLYDQFNKLIDQRRSLYNGLLFAQHECEQLVVGDKILETIFKNVNYPESPYHFDGVGVEILGSIYERFLGQTIRLTPKQVRVEDKPEVRKAGGVYYTPQYIVNYIVDNTVGKLIEGKTPRQVEKLRIIDIACGSGSFLLGAFQKLIDHHVQYYTEHPTEIKEKHGVLDAYEDEQGRLVLSARKKRDILVNNIYGVDIDQQAVEVTQMSLYLKVLENENDATLSKQTMLALHEVLLPPLKNNIKCGNSLIGTDFGSQGELFDEEARRKVNPFDWQIEFKEIIGNGGFDSVIGNPPYVLGRETFDHTWKEYIASNYQSYGGKFDLYVFFTEKAFSVLKEGGKLGYIVPNTILANVNATLLRKTLLARSSINMIKLFEKRVFEAAQVESVILVLTREESQKSRNGNTVKVENENIVEISQASFESSEDYKFNINVDARTSQVLSKINAKTVALGNLSDICIGIQLGGSSGKDKKQAFLASRKKDKTYQKVLDGRDINRYQIEWPGVYVRYGKWLHRRRDEKYFLNRKIIARQIGATPIATFDDDNFYSLNTIYNILILESQYHPKFILSIINSRLGQWMWTKEHSDFKTLFPKIKKDQLEGISIRIIDFNDPADKQMHDELVALVDKMLELHKQPSKASFESEKEPIQRHIAATDKKIDELVYKLYRLTEEEIKIVEAQ